MIKKVIKPPEPIQQLNAEVWIKTSSKELSDKEQQDFQKNLHIWLQDKLNELGKGPYFANVRFSIYRQ